MATRRNKTIVQGEIINVSVDDTAKASKLSIRRKGELTRKMIANDEKLRELSQELDEKQIVVSDLLEQKQVDHQLQQLEGTVKTQESLISERQAEIEELDLTIAALLKKC